VRLLELADEKLVGAFNAVPIKEVDKVARASVSSR